MNKCWIEQYHDDIESGKIITGTYVRIMIDKLMDELHDDDIKKDFSDSNKRIHFIENECRHAQAPFAGKPFELMLWQKLLLKRFIVSRFGMMSFNGMFVNIRNYF